MVDIQIDPQENQEQQSQFEKVFLRIGTVFLCGLMSLILVLLGYAIAIFLELDLAAFNNYTATYFTTSFIIWALIGLFVPMRLYQQFFGSLHGSNAARGLAYFLVFAVFVFVYWFILSFAAEIIASIFFE